MTLARRLALLIALAAVPSAVAAPPPPVEMTPAQAEARYKQLVDQMQKYATRNAWAGVEDAWVQVRELPVEPTPDVLVLAADSARMLGDSWQGYQRLLAVLRALPDDAVAQGQMKIFRERYGRVSVRRVELTPIDLVRSDTPFDADERHSVEFAQHQLNETGGFDGMLPAGEYRLGTAHSFVVVPGLQPAVVQRTLGDGTSKKKN